ncbi:two-component regulator propeller domain-containing protein [uncultured Sunxiuqinia sp.]|uniref:two-component regulator propeller domain-containing protein n=1 Tax=uncultured Sunxiuqinia sp. TaxID=1573825 RepID=UPI0030DABAEA
MKILFGIFTLLFCIQLFAQQRSAADVRNFNPRFEVFRLPGDTYGNSVQGMVQDKTGFLWFATQGGLIRYDGQKFVIYRYDVNNPNSLSNDYIESVFLDSNGTLWMTHWQQGALTTFEPERGIFTRYQHDPDNPESLSGNVLSCVAEDHQGFIWIGGELGLDRYDPETGTFKHFQHDSDDPNSLSYNRVRALYVDKTGTLWVGAGFPWETNSSEGGLNRYHPESETFTRYLHNPGDSTTLISNKVRSILEDSQGNFWIGTVGDGLHLMDREKGTFKRLTSDPKNPEKLSGPWQAGPVPVASDSSTHISSIFEDDEGRIWITAFPGGLKVFDPASGITRHFKRGNNASDLNTDFLWQTYQTKDGTLWVTSGGDGQTVLKVKLYDDLFPFFNIPRNEDESRSGSHGILKDRSGNIWIGHANPAYLERIDRRTGSRTVFEIGDSQGPVTMIHGLMEDREGYLWVGTDRGQFRGNPETGGFQFFQLPGITDDISQDFFMEVLHDRSGHFWFGSWEQGLFRYDPATNDIVNYAHDPNDPNSLGGNLVGSIYEDEKGHIWVGGGSPFGDIVNPLFLDRINPKTNRIEHFFKAGKQLGMLSYITEDNDGNIWFADWLNGLQKLNPATGIFKSFTPNNSLLPSNYLLSLVKSVDGKLWLSDQNSIIEFDPEIETMSVYNANSGIRNAYDHYNSGYVAYDGELFFSRKGGFHAFYPIQILQHKNTRLPDIRITGFHLLGDQNPTAVFDLLEKPIWQTTAIRLAHDQNLFAFSLACFDFYDASSIQLQFMLEGYDKEWRKDVRDGETSPYTNVPPGEYTFRVRGANSFGVWNMEGASMGITVLPPWWRTWWAYGFYLLLLIFSIWQVHKYQKERTIRMEREKSRERELLHAREIEKAYTKLKTTQAQLIQSEKMASLGELTAGIAHEIQNPLNFVNNFSDLNKELIEELKEELAIGNRQLAEEIANDIKENEEKINRHGKRADAIVKGMLQHSRTSNGQKELTDINALADEYLRLSYHGLRAKDKSFHADFKTDFDESLPKISVVPQDIGRVLLNLINNAFYAVGNGKTGTDEKTTPVETRHALSLPQTPPDYNPTVIVSTKNIADHVEIRVKDNGEGIPAEIKDKIFQPFFTTKPTGQGTGLGLSLSYDIVKTHGGELKVESKKGEGTEFIIKIPIL